VSYVARAGSSRWRFPDLKTLLCKASPIRSGDILAGLAAASAEEMAAARMALADAPLADFLEDAFVPYESDEVTRLILDRHDTRAFPPIGSMTVGEFRNWLLSDHATTETLSALAPGVTPEMAAAAAKLMRNQDLILAARKCRVVTRFRNTIGLPGTMAVRLQPNHPTDDPKGIAASIVDGLMYGCGDAVIGVNPASDNTATLTDLAHMLDDIIVRYAIPTQVCVLTHVSTSIEMISRGAPVDLIFQSIAGTQKANESFGISLALLQEAWEAGKSLVRGTVGGNGMYFETGQGSALSAEAHHGLDQQTCEARAYAVARAMTWPLSQAYDAGLEEVEVSATVHLTFDELQLADLAFGLPVGPRQGDCRLDRGFVFGHAAGECRDEASLGSADPDLRVVKGLPSNDALELLNNLSRLHQNGDAVLDGGDCYRLSP
jgi:ethanolamine ammonia-lyase large subunit